MSGFAERYIGLGQQGVADRREEQKFNALQMYLPQAMSAKTPEQRQAVTQGLAQGGAFQEAMGLQNQFKADDAATAQKALQEQERRASLFFDVKDDNSLSMANQIAQQQFGATPDQLPKSVAEAQAQTRMFMSLKDRIEQQFKQQELGLKTLDTQSQVALRQSQMGTERAQQANYYANAAKARRADAPGAINNTTFDNISSLRKEFEGTSKTFKEVHDSFNRIQSSAQNPSAAGDIALVFNFMKMLDPGSVVREGEFATAQNAAGVPQQILNVYNRALSGERLGESQRRDFIGQAGNIYQRQRQTFDQTRQYYDGLSQKFGFDPGLVTRDMSGGAPRPVAPPSPPAPSGVKQVQAQDIQAMISSGQATVLQDASGKNYLRMKDGSEFDLEPAQ